MRNTKDIADAVFRIRDEYLEQKKKKRIRIEKACAAFSAIAAAGLITAGAVSYLSYSKPLKNDEIIAATDTATVLPTETVTDINSTSAHEGTYTATTAASSSEKKASAAASSTVKSTTSMITSAAKTTVSPAAAANAHTADTNNTQPPVTTDINEIDCEEVIRMKVINVKKYLAALSAAAMASSGAVQMPANAESLYTPKPYEKNVDAVIYIEDNIEHMDFNGNGKLDSFDSYALFTYVNESESVPEEYAARCAAYGDINSDGIIDNADSDIFKEYCFLKYAFESYVFYSNNMNYYLPENTNFNEHIYRTFTTDIPSELSEKIRNIFIDESYTYGSEENINSFINYCFYNINNYDSLFDRRLYNNAYYKKFAREIDRISYNFDINEDGNVDLKDLYDIYIYDVASADDEGPIEKNFYFGRLNDVTEVIDGLTVIHSDRVNTLRSRLTIPEADKQHIWDKCEPIYDYVYSFIACDSEDELPLQTITVFELIARYILENTDVDFIKTSDLYYVQYRGIVTLCDLSVSEGFVGDIQSILYEYFDKAGQPVDYDNIIPNDKIFDYENRDTQKNVELIERARADFESGITRDIYDINKDGKIDVYDSYSFGLYLSEMCRGVTMENSVLPADMWKFIDKKVDVDYDGKPGTLGDQLIFYNIAENPYEVPQYKLDIYYLELVEKKGLVDLSDIRPYIEKLCKSKETGDVDLDGKLTAVDSCEVLKYYSQMSVEADVPPVTEAKMEYLADYNGDGVIDSIDASAILSTYSENSVQDQ